MGMTRVSTCLPSAFRSRNENGYTAKGIPSPPPPFLHLHLLPKISFVILATRSSAISNVMSSRRLNGMSSALLPEKKNMPPPPRRRRRRYQLKRHVKRRARDGVDPSREKKLFTIGFVLAFQKYLKNYIIDFETRWRETPGKSLEKMV